MSDKHKNRRISGLPYGVHTVQMKDDGSIHIDGMFVASDDASDSAKMHKMLEFFDRINIHARVPSVPSPHMTMTFMGTGIDLKINDEP